MSTTQATCHNDIPSSNRSQQQLLLQVKAQLKGTHSLAVWAGQEPESALSLPSFNAYPQLSVTAAGEYLMMLPQMLESLLTDSEEGVDTEWLDKVGHLVLSDCDAEM